MTASYKIIHPSGRVSWFAHHWTLDKWCCVWEEVRPHKAFGHDYPAWTDYARARAAE